jgi:hypothetical protein
MLKLWPFRKKNPSSDQLQTPSISVTQTANLTNTSEQLIQNIWQLCEEYFLKVEGEKRVFTVYEWHQQTWSFELKEQEPQRTLQIKTSQLNRALTETVAVATQPVIYHLDLHKDGDCLNCQLENWPLQESVATSNLDESELKLTSIYQLLTQLKQFTQADHFRAQLFAPTS